MAHNIERWMSAMVLRTYSHETILEMAASSRIPVINALSDLEHPCQAIADFLTLEEHFGSAAGPALCLRGRRQQRLSLADACGRATWRRTAPSRRPRPSRPSSEIIHKAIEVAEQTGGSLTLHTDPVKAVEGADAVYTDVCTSMGFEHEATRRAPIFKPYQVNESLMSHAQPEAVFMHCLPAPPQRRSHRRRCSTGRNQSSSSKPKTASTHRKRSCSCSLAEPSASPTPASATVSDESGPACLCHLRSSGRRFPWRT